MNNSEEGQAKRVKKSMQPNLLTGELDNSICDFRVHTHHCMRAGAANHVKSLMIRRNWTVLVLQEFYPSDPRLLGLNSNHGESVQIRLRRAGSISSFLDYSAILHTTLHELVHIEIGPHNAAFYKLFDELVAEVDNLPDPGSSRRRAGSGNSVQAPVFSNAGVGRRLGDISSRPVPRSRAGAAAAAAAMRRAQAQSIMGSGIVGGATAHIYEACDPRELALAAAERRRRDDVWCNSGAAIHIPIVILPIQECEPTDGLMQSPKTMEVIDLDGEDDHGGSVGSGILKSDDESAVIHIE